MNMVQLYFNGRRIESITAAYSFGHDGGDDQDEITYDENDQAITGLEQVRLTILGGLILMQHIVEDRVVEEEMVNPDRVGCVKVNYGRYA